MHVEGESTDAATYPGVRDEVHEKSPDCRFHLEVPLEATLTISFTEHELC
jgi:hypothetical protein